MRIDTRIDKNPGLPKPVYARSYINIILALCGLEVLGNKLRVPC